LNFPPLPPDRSGTLIAPPNATHIQSRTDEKERRKAARELTRDPYWRKKLDEARTAAEVMKIMEEFQKKVKGHSVNVREF